MSERVAIVLIGFVVGCGANQATTPPADAGSEQTSPRARPIACGGDVNSMGSGPDGVFVASYVHVERCDGDCNSLIITVADGATTEGLSFTFVLSHGNSGPFLGPQTVDVLVQRGTQSAWTVLSATVDVTVADPPGLPTTLGAPPFGRVTGTFNIAAGTVDLSGTFSSPVCSSRIAV